MTAREFTEKYYTKRENTNATKWDCLTANFTRTDLLPLWVADMDFKAPESVLNALQERIAHGVFGYSIIPDSYYAAVIDWQKKRHGNTLEKDWFRFGSTIVSSLYNLINAFTKENDAVIVINPVYYPFHHAVRDNNRKLITCEMVNENGNYCVDYEKFENDIAINKVKAFIFCSPHNPVGKVWTEEELDRLFSICEKHGVLILSDEIHQDLIIGDKKQVPAFAVSSERYIDSIITLASATKSFNLAALNHSHLFIPNEKLRTAYDQYMSKLRVPNSNLIGYLATESAYNGGEAWLEGLLAVISENYRYMKDTFAKALPQAVVAPLEGTYLVWVDLRGYIKDNEMKSFMEDKCRIAVDYGEWFSPEYQGFIRVNLATSLENVKTAVGSIVNELV